MKITKTVNVPTKMEVVVPEYYEYFGSLNWYREEGTVRVWKDGIYTVTRDEEVMGKHAVPSTREAFLKAYDKAVNYLHKLISDEQAGE